MSRANKKIDGQPAGTLELKILCDKTSKIKDYTIQYIAKLGKTIGTFFEPEMAFVMIETRQQTPGTILYEIYPAGGSSTEFRTYLNFSLKLAASTLYFLNINESFSDEVFLGLESYQVLEKLIDRPLRENELKTFRSGISFNNRKCVIYRWPAIALLYKVHGSFLEANQERENANDFGKANNEKMLFEYHSLNYEICYFSLNYKYSSLILIGGKKYEIFFPRSFCERFKPIIAETMANFFSEKHLPDLLEYVESYFRMIRSKSSLSRIGLKHGYESVYYRCLNKDLMSRNSMGNYLRTTIEIPEEIKKDIHLLLTGHIGNKMNIKDYTVYNQNKSDVIQDNEPSQKELSFIYLDKDAQEEDM